MDHFPSTEPFQRATLGKVTLLTATRCRALAACAERPGPREEFVERRHDDKQIGIRNRRVSASTPSSRSCRRHRESRRISERYRNPCRLIDSVILSRVVPPNLSLSRGRISVTYGIRSTYRRWSADKFDSKPLAQQVTAGIRAS